jgi:hypothetical protein
MMAIPIIALGSRASVSDLLGPIAEFSRSEINRIKGEIRGEGTGPARTAPTHVGFGIEAKIPTIEEGDLRSTLAGRFDLATLPIFPTSPPLPASQSTPSLHLSNTLTSVDEYGEQNWLVGGPLQATRLRSVELNLHCNQDGWDADVILSDAVYNGVIDETAEIPGEMRLSSSVQNTDLGIGETMAELFSSHRGELGLPGTGSEFFLRTLELIGLGVPPDPNDVDASWAINNTNLVSLTQNPSSYLNALLYDSQGDWNLCQPLNNGENILQVLAQLLPHSTIIDLPGEEEHDSLCIPVPLSSHIGAEIFLHPNGLLMFKVNGFPLGKTSLSVDVRADLASGSHPSGDGFNVFCDAQLQLTQKQRGLFAGSFLSLIYDEQQPADDQLVIDLHMPKLGVVLAPLHNVDAQDDGDASWIPTPESIRLHPPPTVGNQSLGEFLSTTSPTVILETVVCLAIDAYLLSRLEENGLLGEVMEVLDLVEQQPGGHYTCASILDFVCAPRDYLESLFIVNDGINVSKVLELAEALLRAFNLPFYEGSIVLELGKTSDTVFAELAVMVHPQNPNGLTISLRSPENQEPTPLQLEFDLRANITPGPVFDIDGTSLSLIARPNDLIAQAGGSTTTFPANSFVELTASLDQGTLALDLDLCLDGTTTSHCTLLPNVSGFSSLLNSSLGSVVPNLLTLLLRNKLTNVTFGSSNHNLGDILIEFFHDINLWTPPSNWSAGDAVVLRAGSIDGALFSSIALNPRQWVMGPEPGEQSPVFATAAFETLLISGVRTVANIVLDDQIVSSTESGSADYVTITIGNFPVITITIGRVDANNFGLWVNVSPDVQVGMYNTNVPRWLDVDVTAGCTFELPTASTAFSLQPSAQISARITHEFTSGTLRIKPALQFSWAPSTGFVLQAATDQQDSTNAITWMGSGGVSGNGFWLKWTSTGTPALHKGMPSLADLASGSLDIITGFVENLTPVQEWLTNPLITVAGTPIMVSKPGEIGDALGVMSWNQTENQYEFDSNLIGVVQGWIADPVGIIINAICGLIEQEIDQNGTERLTLFEQTGGDFEFQISIVDANDTPGEGTFGISFDFNDLPPFELGKLRLQLFTQDKGWLNDWTNRGVNNQYSSGVTVYFAEWASAGAAVSPHLSLEIGGIGFRLIRDDGQPLLEKFLVLNTVEAIFAMDLNILPAAPLEVGAQLVLDDFGIELGGGSEDGGNGMAKGLLSGGDDGKDAVKPIFDIMLSKYHTNPFDLSIRGGTEFWFPINKQFGPVNVIEAGVRYSEDNSGKYDNPHRLSILLDAKAEISGFQAACDDLGVNIPILRPFDFQDWGFELKKLGIKMDKEKLKIAGALAKQDELALFTHDPINPHGLPSETILDTSAIPQNSKVLINGQWEDATWALPYVEYQGLCSIVTPAFGISAVGAFARVPKPDGTGFVSCFIIAALDMPIGGPPFFFVNGLLGGLGLNRDLVLPSIDEVENHLLIDALGGFSDPLAALGNIKPQFPVKYGSFWFALGLKFKTVEIMETRAVLFARFGDGFTIGLLGLSTMDLPKPSMRIAHIELAIMAYYDSGENVLWVQAQLTDDSYLFDESCRLTGGFALVTWFNTGEFVISLGGYHPSFNVPDYYPVVPRLGFNWKPSNTLTVKGGVYFTLCSRAVMLGGRLDASFEKGKIRAAFVAGMDALVEFDPFFYSLDMYINLSIRVGKLKAGIGADLHIEGPKMNGLAELEVLFVKFKVKFGQHSSPPPQLNLKEFVHKHIRQLPSSDPQMPVSSWLNSNDAHTTTMVEGIIRSKEQAESDMGALVNPYLVGPEFAMSIASKFPSTTAIFLGGLRTQGKDPKGVIRGAHSMVLYPINAGNSVSPNTHIRLFDRETDTELTDVLGLDYIPSLGGFAPSTWSSAGKTSTEAARFFMNGGMMKASAMFEDGGQCIAFEGNIEPCEMDMHLPLEEDDDGLNSMIGSLEDVVTDSKQPPISLMESILTDEKVSRNASLFKGEVEKQGSFRKTEKTIGKSKNGVEG